MHLSVSCRFALIGLDKDDWEQLFGSVVIGRGASSKLKAVIVLPQTGHDARQLHEEADRLRAGPGPVEAQLETSFSSFEEFINWYNDRPHGSLNFQSLETPEMAFRRKMPLEAYFAIGHRLFGL